MKKRIIDHIPFLTIFSLIVVFLSACASFGPTKPYPVIARYPGYAELSVRNKLLADEIGKLPELQDGVSQSEITALETLIKLYNSSPEKFNKVFEEMYQIGLPEVRKYCSPLQALFWLAENGKLNKKNNPLIGYSPKKLLDMAWKPNLTFPSDMPDEQLFTIINRIKVKKERERYLLGMRNIDRVKLQEILLVDYKIHPKMFTRKARKIMEQSLIYLDPLRWRDFSTVVERLNAPELLDYYINHTITYKKNRTNSHTPKHTFSHQWGDCDDVAVFGKYILRKGGYKANIRYVHWTADNRGHVGVVIKLEDGRYFLAVDFGGKNIMTGPYTKISEVDEMLSRGNIFHDSGWWRQPR